MRKFADMEKEEEIKRDFIQIWISDECSSEDKKDMLSDLNEVIESIIKIRVEQ